MSAWLVGHVPSWLLLIGVIVLVTGLSVLVQILVRRRFPGLAGEEHNDVLRFAAAILGQDDVFAPKAIERFTRRETAPPGTSRTLGWDTPTPPSQSGRYFSAHSVGHLGYSGTSLWIDLDREIAVTLLTNRVYTDSGPANTKIQQVRPEFHDAVMQTLLAE